MQIIKLSEISYDEKKSLIRKAGFETYKNNGKYILIDKKVQNIDDYVDNVFNELDDIFRILSSYLIKEKIILTI